MRLERFGQLIVSLHDTPPGPADVRAELDAVATAQAHEPVALLSVVGHAFPPPSPATLRLYASAVRRGVPPIATAVVLLQDGARGYVARATVAALLRLRGAPARVFDAIGPACDYLAGYADFDVGRVHALLEGATPTRAVGRGVIDRLQPEG